MNEALQALEIKVENGGATPQGKFFAKDWNTLVEAVKQLDLAEFDEEALNKYLKDNGYITSDDIPSADLSDLVTLSTEQTIPGPKNFTGALKVNGQPLIYDAELGVWELTGDLLVTGNVAWFASIKGFKPSTIMDAVQVDGETIVKNELGQLKVIGGGSGGSGGGLTVSDLSNYLTTNKYTKQSDVETLISTALTPYALTAAIPTNNNQLSNGAGYITAAALNGYAKTTDIPSLTGYATEQWVTNKGYITSSALNGYATQIWVENKKYLTGITSSQVTTALGYTPYNSSNPDKYIKGIDYDMVIAALGYTPYSTTNPMGYLTSSSLLGYATEQWVGDNYLASSNFSKANIKSTLGISDWALAATKPSYTAAEVGALATSGGTINGSTTLATGNLIVSQGDTVVGNLYPTSDNTKDLGQGIRRWLDIFLGGYLSWGNSVDMTDIGDWNALKGNYGLRIISSITTDSGAPYTYATALHVKGRYGFELAVQGGDIDSFAIRSITYNREWKELIHSGNIGSYNAGSATKLATPRTIWGQSFDGTGNIATTLHITSKDVGSYNEGIRINNIGGYSSIWFNTINKEGYDAGMWGITANNGGNLRIRGGDTALVDFVNITRAGNVAIGGTTASAKLHVHGNAQIDGDVLVNGNVSWITQSQRSLKDITSEQGLSLAQLERIKPIKFYWKDGRDAALHVGGVADVFAEVLPEVVARNKGVLCLNYVDAAFYVGASLIAPVLDHDRRIAQLESENAELKQKLNQLAA